MRNDREMVLRMAPKHLRPWSFTSPKLKEDKEIKSKKQEMRREL